MLNSSVSASAERFLGISAKSSNASSVKLPDSKTGKLDARRKKYALQRTAQSLLWNSAVSKQHRVCTCHRNVASDGVVVYRAIDGSDSRLGNLISCGSVWSCPVCNSKITESRRAEMQKASSAWLVKGGSCLLMTLTTEHEADQSLDEVLDVINPAINDFNNHRGIKSMFGTSIAQVAQAVKKNKPLKNVVTGQHSRLGYVRSLEVTHGVNGWHPHFHIVMFMSDDKLLQDQTAQEIIKKIWVECLIKNGADRSKVNYMLEKALDIRGGDYASDYINKFGREPVEMRGWTIAHEVTKANSKTASRKMGNDWHYTPFQLLAYATDGDSEAGELFKEFSAGFEGRRMNYWTNGLKDWFEINDATDDDLTADEPEQINEEFVIRLDTEQWRDVLATNSRGELLKAAAIDGEQGVIALLEDIKIRPKQYRGWFSDHARPDVSRFYH